METGTDFRGAGNYRESESSWKKELPICLLLSIIFGIYVTSASEKMNNRQDYRPRNGADGNAIFSTAGHLRLAAITHQDGSPGKTGLSFRRLL